MELVKAVTALQSSVESSRREFGQRFEDLERRQDERHAENRDRLDAINGKVGKAHDRASKLETLAEAAAAEILRLRTRYHELFGALQKVVPGLRAADSKDRGITVVEARWMIGYGISALTAGALVTVWVLKLVGKL